MKKILTAICLILLCALFIVSCDSSSSYEDNNNYDSQTNFNTSASSTTSSNNYNDSYNDNYVSPTPDEIEEFASETSSPSPEPTPDSTDCLSHNWVSATCTKPKTCSKCGATEGEPKGHNYKSYGDYKCGCGEVDPKVTETLAKCSLELPNLPQEVKRYGYNNSLQSSVSVTKIVPTFKYYGSNDKNGITLTVKISGTKTYDYQGSNQSSPCYIGWKLYDPDGNVFSTGTFYSSNIAMGESFASKEEDLIYNFEAAAPGAYKLVLLNVN